MQTRLDIILETVSALLNETSRGKRRHRRVTRSYHVSDSDKYDRDIAQGLRDAVRAVNPAFVEPTAADNNEPAQGPYAPRAALPIQAPYGLENYRRYPYR